MGVFAAPAFKVPTQLARRATQRLLKKTLAPDSSYINACHAARQTDPSTVPADEWQRRSEIPVAPRAVIKEELKVVIRTPHKLHEAFPHQGAADR